MQGLMWGRRAAAAATVLFALCLAVPAGAQTPSVTAADIQRLQDQVYDAGNDVSRLRDRDPGLADRLQEDLDNLRDEVVYLKVKLRREGQLSRDEYTDVRDRLSALRNRARGVADEPSASVSPTKPGVPPPAASSTTTTSTTTPESPAEPARQGTSSRPNEVPVGTELDVRLQTQLSSDTAKVEDRFEGTTMVDLVQGGKVLVPAGSPVRGVVSSVDKAGRVHRTGRLTLSFDQITVNGRAYPIHATVTQAIESAGIRGEVGKIGAGAGVGAIIGGILGGFKGALAGILIGAGGTVAATEGKDVTLPAGTVLRLRFDSPLTVR